MKRRKAVIIGLDGVPYTLLREYIERGMMPNLSGMCAEGSLYRMRSTLPEVSSVAWSSFMTGKNPAEHGIFGFMEIDRETYEYTFPNFNSIREKPFWERGGLKTVAFNIPQTYPARPMDGVIVSGFVALDLRKATYPERVYRHLDGMGYRIDVQANLAKSDPHAFIGDIFTTFEKRKEAMEYLYENEEWDLFIGTVTETDRLHHFFFDSARGGHNFHVFEKFYRELDIFLGRMFLRAKEDGAVFLTCSDHGFTPITTEVYLNKWLVEKGYLKLDGDDGLQGITPDSACFCLDPSRLYIHLSGKYKKGGVKASDYQDVRNEVAREFSALEYDGKPVAKKVFFKEEIFKGRFSEDGPDLYVLPNYGFDLKGAVGRKDLFGRSHFTGMHTYDDAHLYISDTLVESEDLTIEKIAGIVTDAINDL